jgi:putative ABC transport system substrate-binding protein
MNRRSMLALAGSLAAGAAAAQPARVRIGWLTGQREASLVPFMAALRQGLAAYGYVEGRNLTIESRFADDDASRVPALAAELVRQQVSVLMVQGAAVPIVARLDLPVPLVFTLSGDPVAAGLAQSLARPNRGLTGITFMAAEMNGKRLELLREMLPGIRRVAILGNPDHPGEPLERAAANEVARRYGLAITHYATRNPDEFQAAFAAMRAQPPQAISIFADGIAIQNRGALAGFGIVQRLPVISAWAVFAEAGALCTFGPRLAESYKRLAYFVDRILRGAKPEDLPIEQPTAFELVLNQKTATTIGLTFPPTLLAQADRIIE